MANDLMVISYYYSMREKHSAPDKCNLFIQLSEVARID